MTELNDLVRVERLPVQAVAELRFPVAYSHGGFAQLRHTIANNDVNPVGPLQVPAELSLTFAPDYCGANACQIAVL